MEEQRAQLEKAFKTFDADGSGFLNETELRNLMCGMGDRKLTDEKFSRLMKSMDSNQDGKISVEELITYIIGAPPAAASAAETVAPKETVCTFESCDGTPNGFDNKGCFFLIGTKGGTQPYENPHDGDQVKCEWSTRRSGDPAVFVDYEADGFSCTRDAPDSYMQVDMRGYRVGHPTYYAIRHGNSKDGHHRLIHWRLSASHDGKHWIILDREEHRATDKTGLPDAGHSTAAFPIGGDDAGQSYDEAKGTEPPWRYFRLTQTGKDSNGHNGIFCAGFEIYGTLSGYEW